MNAYSEDLRKKKIVQALSRGMGKSEAARSFGVSLSSVKRYARMADEGRSLAPKKRPGSRPKMDEGARRLLESDVEERPAATLPQRREYLQKVGGRGRSSKGGVASRSTCRPTRPTSTRSSKRSRRSRRCYGVPRGVPARP
jgi:transposase